MINWKVRFKNKTFWITLIPALLLLISQVCEIFGLNLDATELSNQLVGIVGTIFGILSILGIVTDHTTDGFSDSDAAMDYDTPKVDEEEQIESEESTEEDE